jgi:hypothetical protein
VQKFDPPGPIVHTDTKYVIPNTTGPPVIFAMFAPNIKGVAVVAVVAKLPVTVVPDAGMALNDTALTTCPGGKVHVNLALFGVTDIQVKFRGASGIVENPNEPVEAPAWPPEDDTDDKVMVCANPDLSPVKV